MQHPAEKAFNISMVEEMGKKNIKISQFLLKLFFLYAIHFF